MPPRRGEDAVMVTFTVGLPRWPILLRLFGRDPLVRTADRIEALALVLAVVVSVLCVPIAAAFGTAVYESNRHLYAEQTHSRHSVAATVTEVPRHILRTSAITVQAQWSADGAERTGTVKAPSTTTAGDSIEIWLDDGAQVPAPTPTTRAAADALVAAVAIWVSVIAAVATLFAITRALCDRIRFTGWQHDLDSLVGHGDGHTTNQP